MPVLNHCPNYQALDTDRQHNYKYFPFAHTEDKKFKRNKHANTVMQTQTLGEHTDNVLVPTVFSLERGESDGHFTNPAKKIM